MSLPTPTKLAAAVQAVAPTVATQINVLGFNIDASQIEAVVTVAIDALCMKAWKDAQAVGQAAADAITTPAQAEASERAP